jgi:hypothetical protein
MNPPVKKGSLNVDQTVTWCELNRIGEKIPLRHARFGFNKSNPRAAKLIPELKE